MVAWRTNILRVLACRTQKSFPTTIATHHKYQDYCWYFKKDIIKYHTYTMFCFFLRITKILCPIRLTLTAPTCKGRGRGGGGEVLKTSIKTKDSVSKIISAGISLLMFECLPRHGGSMVRVDNIRVLIFVCTRIYF